jgi:hypothetical protein
MLRLHAQTAYRHKAQATQPTMQEGPSRCA